MLDELSMVVARLYLEIPDIHLKRAWPTMQLQAMVGNALGGKGDGSERMDPAKAWRPEEFTPPFARGAEGLPQPALEPQHCWAFQQALETGQLEGASWVVHLLAQADDLERVRLVGEGYGELLTQ